MKGDEPTSPSLFTFYSQLAALRRVSRDILVTARSNTRPEGRSHRHIVHVQSFVRAFVVIDIDKSIGIERIKPGQCEMHELMTKHWHRTHKAGSM